MQEDIVKPNAKKRLSLNLLAKRIRLLTDKLNAEFSLVKSKNNSKTPVTSYKTFTFIQKVLVQAEKKTDQISSENSLDVFREDIKTLNNLQDLEFSLEKLQTELKDTIQTIRYDLYAKSKEIQDHLKNHKQLN